MHTFIANPCEIENNKSLKRTEQSLELSINRIIQPSEKVADLENPSKSVLAKNSNKSQPNTVTALDEIIVELAVNPKLSSERAVERSEERVLIKNDQSEQGSIKVTQQLGSSFRHERKMTS